MSPPGGTIRLFDDSIATTNPAAPEELLAAFKLMERPNASIVLPVCVCVERALCYVPVLEVNVCRHLASHQRERR